MKIRILALLLLVTTITFGQDKDITYNELVPEYVLAFWKNNGAANSEAFDIEALEELKSFLNELRKKDNQIASINYFTKPSENTLVGHYLYKKLKWNSFNGPHVGIKKLKPKKVVSKELEKLPTKEELLAHYYLSMSSDILNKQKPMNLKTLNIDFDNLNLDNDTEKAILFLCLMRHMGAQVSSYAMTRFPNNCFRAKTYVENMPTFNGKAFHEFELPEFDDFKIEVDKRYPKGSFKKRYLPEFENAKAGYDKCLKQDKN